VDGSRIASVDVRFGVVVGCRLVFDLFMRSWTAGLDGFRRRGPILQCELEGLWTFGGLSSSPV
jgi:hypothetical protein